MVAADDEAAEDEAAEEAADDVAADDDAADDDAAEDELVEAATVVEELLEGTGHVGSLMVTLVVCSAEHTWLSVPATSAAWTCSGEMLRPRSWLLAATTVKTLALDCRRVGTRLNNWFTVQVKPPRSGQFSVATTFV